MKNAIVGLKELRENVENYITEVRKGKSFTVVRRSKPIFKIVPAESDEQWETIADFTTINRNGVPARDILEALRKMNAES